MRKQFPPPIQPPIVEAPLKNHQPITIAPTVKNIDGNISPPTPERQSERQGRGRLLLVGDDRADVRGADFLEFLIDDPVRQFGLVTVTAEMREHNMLELGRGDFTDHSRGLLVAQVAMPAHDSLLGRPRADLIFLEHFDVMVGFEDDQIHAADSFDHQFCCMAQIRDKRDRVRRCTQPEADRIAGVVGDAKGLDGEIADFKCAAGGK